MLKRMFGRKDVCNFIEELFSGSYSNKKYGNTINYFDIDVEEITLFTFIDALFKYEIIIENDIFIDEYIVQIRKLFKKLDNFNDINLGICKLIGKFTALKLDILDLDEREKENRVLDYVYNKYIENGYLFHGFNGVYKEQIMKYGFVPHNYQYLYPKFVEVYRILSSALGEEFKVEDFLENYVYFTDSFINSCCYGISSPLYFSNLFRGNNAYYNNDYFKCFSNLNNLMKRAKLNSRDIKYITKVCNEEWKVLQKNNSNINIMLVKRKKLGYDSKIDINTIKASDDDLGNKIFKIFSSKANEIKSYDRIDSNDISFIEIPNYKMLFELRKKQISNDDFVDLGYSNIYGKVSFLILIGSLLITLGVIITIISIGRGI